MYGMTGNSATFAPPHPPIITPLYWKCTWSTSSSPALQLSSRNSEEPRSKPPDTPPPLPPLTAPAAATLLQKGNIGMVLTSKGQSGPQPMGGFGHVAAAVVFRQGAGASAWARAGASIRRVALPQCNRVLP